MVTVFFAVVALRIAIKGEAHWYNIPFVGGEMLYLYFISKRDNENWLELVPLLIASLVYLIHYQSISGLVFNNDEEEEDEEEKRKKRLLGLL